MMSTKHLLLLLLLTGCASISPESVYESIRSQQTIHSSPAIPNPLILPPYEQYKKEREASRKLIE
ncbi:MAG: hypothetical protein EBQ82_10985 [Betaproteobacteria bacterium]|nr:hypothetical protein [Betaproteobacteria bacterium]